MRWSRRVFTVVVVLTVLAVPFIVWWQAQALVDWWQLRGYTPPAAIAALAKDDTMTPYAIHVFYVNHPDLEADANQFRDDCNETEQTIVLGCYHSNQGGIFLYDVTDPRLAGVEQVTAAHEMLHAAYDRLSSKDRSYVDGLLQDYYKHDLHDQRIIQTMNAYKQTEPNDVVNEMHSVFGTEIASLPPALENYYKRYFTDRQTVARYAANYQNEFTGRQSEIKADDAQLAQQLASINQLEVSLNSQLAKINSDRSQLESLKSSGRFGQYNSQVGGFNAEVDSYNAGVSQVKAAIDSYNQLVAQRNSVASELASLDKSIDTRPLPQTTQ